MRKLSLRCVALAALAAAPAMAADNVVKAPYPVPPPIPAWTGAYYGFNAGFGWTRDELDTTVASSFCNPTLGGCPAIAGVAAATIPPVFNTNAKGFIGGGQLGYNYQSGAIVWGIETDFQAASINGANAQTLAAPLVPGVAVRTAGFTESKLDFLGTTRGRVGATPIAPLLLFATGGLAYGHVSSSTILAETAVGPCSCGPSSTAKGSVGATRVGWAAGAGAEWLFTAYASVRVEWLHYDLGSTSYDWGYRQFNVAGVPFFGVTGSSSIHFRGDIVRAGLNLKFGPYSGTLYGAY